MRATDPMPTPRTLLRWSLGAVFVALGVLELVCSGVAGSHSMLLAAVKIAVGVTIVAGTAANFRLVLALFAGDWRARLRKAIKSE